jgi:glycerophosphoryl diester phosphodiesterase
MQVKWSGGKKFEDKFVETLTKYGYKGEYMSEDWLKQPLFIQCYAPTSLIYISNMTKSPKLLLIDDTTVRTQDTNQVIKITSKQWRYSFLRKNLVFKQNFAKTCSPTMILLRMIISNS